MLLVYIQVIDHKLVAPNVWSFLAKSPINLPRSPVLPALSCLESRCSPAPNPGISCPTSRFKLPRFPPVPVVCRELTALPCQIPVSIPGRLWHSMLSRRMAIQKTALVPYADANAPQTILAIHFLLACRLAACRPASLLAGRQVGKHVGRQSVHQSADLSAGRPSSRPA